MTGIKHIILKLNNVFHRIVVFFKIFIVLTHTVIPLNLIKN